MNPQPRTSGQSAVSVRASSQSGISITTDDVPPDFDQWVILRSTNPVPAEGVDWGRWLNNGIPYPLHCMELFRLVLIGGFPLLHRGVPRWMLLFLHSEIYFHWPSSLAGAADSRNPMSFDELHVLLWREHRTGLCQWGEIIIRRLRNRFPAGGPPRDFDAAFRQSEQRLLNPDILPIGVLGRSADWGNATSGVDNPRADGVNSPNWDGEDDDSERACRISVPLHTSNTPMSVRDRAHSEFLLPPADETDEDFLPYLEMDEDLEIDHQVESETVPISRIVPPFVKLGTFNSRELGCP